LDLSAPDTWSKLSAYIENDKKNSANSSRWVLLEKLGKPYEKSGEYTMPLSLYDLAATWERFLKL
jgi:3-dehydroquinate synthetase